MTTESQKNDATLDGFATEKKAKAKRKEVHAEPVAEPVTETPAAEPVAEPVQAPVPTGDELDARIYEVLKKRNIRSAVPTLVEFRMTDGNRKRYALVEIDRDTMEAAWGIWRDAKGAGDHEAFMLTVHEIISTRLPRIYRQVDPLALE